MIWSLTSCSGPVSVRCWSVPPPVGVVSGKLGHSRSGKLGHSRSGELVALPQQVLLVLHSLTSNFLISTFLKPIQSMAPRWSSSSSFRTLGSHPLTAVQGETKKGAHALNEVESFTRSGFLVQGRAMWRVQDGKMMVLASHRPGLVRVQ